MPELRTWWRLDGMEEGGGLRFLLRFDPGEQVDRTLLGVSLSALFSRFLGWTKNGQGRAIADDGRESAAAAVVSAAALTAAVSVCLAAMQASGRRPRLPPRRPTATSGPSSAIARPRALPALDDGLKILSSKAESSETVIHGASIGAGDDEPVIVARVATTPADDTAGAEADVKTEHRQSEEGRQRAERLREMWVSLVEREQRLELRLQELEALRDQEAAARELESRVAAAANEARMLEMKVASLQEENARLRARLEELDDARAELARAQERLRDVEARAEREREEARREAAALQARVADLERGEEERAAEVAAEAAALREANAALEEENMELALRLRDAEQDASSARLAVQEQEDMAEQARQLRETNVTLTRQVEQLRSDQYAHVEELVYLKWVNACLRHELSEHGLHPPCSEHQDADDGSAVMGGRMSALELSKSMSFRSSERAKQLMHRYGHPGLDPALFSPLHEAIMDGYGARSYDEPAQRSPAGTSVTATTAANSTATASGKKPRKLKFLGNFKKLLPGGKRSHSSHGGGGRDERGRDNAPAPMPSDEYLEKAMQWLSTHDVLDFDHSYETTPLSSCDRTPPSSTTTVTPRGGRRSERGGAAKEDDAEPAAAGLARSRSDGGKSYGREAGRYHSLRPDHPAADEAVVAPQKKWERRRRSEELRSPGTARA